MLVSGAAAYYQTVVHLAPKVYYIAMNPPPQLLKIDVCMHVYDKSSYCRVVL